MVVSGRAVKRFAKRLAFWLLLTLPLSAGVGAALAFLESSADDFRQTALVVNGALAGMLLASLGAVTATATTFMASEILRQAGGSERLTGAVIAYGVVGIGLALLHL